MRRASLIVSMLLMPVALIAQAPPAGSKIAVIDMQRAMTETTEGKKVQAELMAQVAKRQAEFESKQKALEDMQTKLRTQDKALSDTARVDLTRQIEQGTTELERLNQDAQRDLTALQQKLLEPIYQRTGRILNAYASEAGFAVVFDVSVQGSNVVYANDTADITTEVIRRVDADVSKPAAAPAKPAEPSKP